nr:A/G-specific adenine glycosylase [Bacteroidota bacterium]
MEISTVLFNWYDYNKRDLPWRQTRDPYKIWLSEIIFQQTRINQGLEYYQKFVENFPSVHDLANADIDSVLKLWQGLGYYSRAGNLHAAAKDIAATYKGTFPSTYNQLIKLPGIGPYTAAAISSLAFNLVHPVMDGNVLRVVSRWFAIDDPVNSSKGKKKIEQILSELIDTNEPGKFNQAIMEFGALFCKPQKPACHDCVFSKICMAFQQNRVVNFPVKLRNLKPKTRYFNYLVILNSIDNQTVVYLQKRNGKDIWKGLYDFPVIETAGHPDMDMLMKGQEWDRMAGKMNMNVSSVSKIYRHQLTHQKIFTRFIEITSPDKFQPENIPAIPVDIDDLQSYPIPRLIDKYLHDRGML